MGKTKSKLYLTKSERYKIQESEKKKKRFETYQWGGHRRRDWRKH